MDNRTMRTVLVCLTIWYGWLLLFPPEVPLDDATDVASEQAPGGEQAALSEAPPPPAAAPSGPIETHPIALCGARGEVTTEDGSLRAVTLKDYEDRYEVQALYSWALSGFSGAWSPYGEQPANVQLLTTEARALVAGVGPMKDGGSYAELVSRREGEIVTRSRVGDIEITRTLSSRDGDDGCEVVVEVDWRNLGAAAFEGPAWFAMHDQLPEAGGRYELSMRPWLQTDGSVDYADDLEALESPEKVDGQADWFGLADTYFASLVLVGEADAPGDGYLTYSRRLSADGAALHGVQYTQDLRLAPGATQSETFRVYLGPKSMEQLEAYDPRLGGAIDLGVLSFFAVVLMHMLKAVHAVVGDWALAIIGLTFLIKAAFFPLTQQSFRSQRAMQVIQPEMKKIQEEYKDNPEELQRRMVELFREAGVNPASGCIPMIVQMPVWFALYSVLLSAVELYHAKFLYLEDLTQPDPYLALPTLVMGLMFLQQRMMPTANMDPAQARLMKLMPLIFGFLFFMFPAGLALYVFVNMLLSIVQQWYIKRTFNSAEPAGAATGA